MPFLERLGVTGVRLGFDPKARLSREVGISRIADNPSAAAVAGHGLAFVGPFEWDSDEMLALIRDLAAT